MQMTNAFGQCCLIPAATNLIIFELMPTKSSRDMPGFLGTPAVTMTTSAPLSSSYLLLPVNLQSKFSTEESWQRSRALPSGIPSTTSKKETSPRCFIPASRPSVAPIWPAPTREILLRRGAVMSDTKRRVSKNEEVLTG